MNILLLTSEFPPYVHGGVGRYCHEVYTQLKKTHSIDVLCVPVYKTEKLKKYDISNVEINKDGNNKIVFLISQKIKDFLHCKTSQPNWFKNVINKEDEDFQNAFRSLRKQYDIVYVQDYFVSFVAAYLSLNNIAKKIISCIHLPLYAGFTYFDKTIDDEFHQALEAILVRFSNKIIVPSKFTKRVLAQIYSIDPTKIYPTPLGVRQIKLNGITPDKSGLRVNGSKKVRLLSVSRFTEQKGLTYIFEILAKLKRRNVPFQYTLIGSGPKESDFKAMVQENDFESEICHIRHIDHDSIFKFYHDSHLYISTSIYETFGLSILEAMSQSCIPIGFNLAAIKELIINNHNGLLIDLADRDDIANKITEYYDNPQKFENMRSEGLKFAKNFTWEKHTGSIMGIFNDSTQE